MIVLFYVLYMVLAERAWEWDLTVWEIWWDLTDVKQNQNIYTSNSHIFIVLYM